MRSKGGRRWPRSSSRYLFYIVLAFCQLACQRMQAPATKAGAFFPLIPGTIWKYQAIDEVANTTTTFTDKVEQDRYAANGPLTEDDSDLTSSADETVVSETTGSGGQVLMLYKPGNQYIARSVSYGNLAAGSLDRQILSREQEFLPRVLKPGVHWSNTVYPFGGVLRDFKIVEKHLVYAEDRTVTVPAGQFSNCIRIETTAAFATNSLNSRQQRRHLKYLDWCAPNVGLVKTTLLQPGLFDREIAKVELVQLRHMPFKEALPPPHDLAEHRTAIHPGLMQ